MLDGFPDKFWSEDTFNFTQYSTEISGRSFFSAEWDFLFAAWWPDDLGAAKERAAYVIKHGAAPPKEDWEKHWGYG